MIKMFVCDLDGTLLNKDHRTDEIILNGLKEVGKSKKIFVSATGRSLHAKEVHRLGLDHYYRITGNGSMIKDQEGKVLYEKPIPKEDIMEMMDEFKDQNLEFILSDVIITDKSFEVICDQFFNGPFSAYKDDSESIDNFFSDHIFNVDREQILNSTIYKINCLASSPEEKAHLKAYLEKHHETLVNAPTSGDFFEITSRSVNKGEAVEWLVNYLGLTKKEVMVFGDSGNDLDMLRRFPYSYAPSNASPLAIAAAHFMIGNSEAYSVIKKITETLKQE